MERWREKKLCRRLEELEKITAAATERIDNRDSADAALEKILTLLRANNFQQGPKESLRKHSPASLESAHGN